MKRLLWLLGIIVVLINTVSANPLPKEKVRVGFPEIEGFSSYKADGSRTGYICDYLEEIRFYTGWQYEFVEGTLEELVDQLQQGTIDLLAPIYEINENAEYELVEMSVGEISSMLITKETMLLAAKDYEVIGILADDKIGQKALESYCVGAGRKMQFKYYADKQAMQQALEQGDIQAYYGSVFDIANNQKVVEKIKRYPYYFAVNANRPDLSKMIKNAIYYIKYNKPSLEDTLYTAYFVESSTGKYYTTEEEVYLQTPRIINVGYIDKWSPFSYYNEQTNEVDGIMVAYLQELLRDTKVQLVFEPIETVEKAYEQLDANKLDLFIGTLEMGERLEPTGHRVSNPVLDLQQRIVSNKNAKENKKLVMPYVLKGTAVSDLNEEQYIYHDLETLISYIDKHPEYYAVGESYTTMALVNSSAYKNIIFQPTEERVKICFIIQGEEDVLYYCINKAINNFEEEVLNTIVYDKLITSKMNIPLSQIINIYTKEVIIVLVILLIFIIAVIVAYFRLKLAYQYQINSVLKKTAERDCLTGLYNRNTCEIKLEKYIQESGDSVNSALILIDIDHFKEVNDTLGHVVGDQVIKKTAAEIRDIFHEDIVGRWGGDEFMVFIKHYDEDIVERVKDLCIRMNQVVRKQQKQVAISVSVGITILDAEKKQKGLLRKFYEEADQALYEVKEHGKNGYYIYEN